MDVTYSHCAGLDLHKKTVVACCMIPGKNSKGETISVAIYTYQTSSKGAIAHGTLTAKLSGG